MNTLLCARVPGFWTSGEPQEGREQCGVRWRYEQGGLTQGEELKSQPGHRCEGRGVCSYNNLFTAGALPAGSELTFGCPVLFGLPVSPCCMGAVVGAQVDFQLGSRMRVFITNLPWHQVGLPTQLRASCRGWGRENLNTPSRVCLWVWVQKN